MALVSIIKATYNDIDVDSLLAPFGGMGQFVEKDEKILLKPNADKPQQSESKSLSGSSFKSEKVGFDPDPDPDFDFDRDDLFLYQNVCVLMSFKFVRDLTCYLPKVRKKR